MGTTAATVLVRFGAKVYNMRNLDLHERTGHDLCRILGVASGLDTKRVGFQKPGSDRQLDPFRTLEANGVAPGDVLDAAPRDFVSVISPAWAGTTGEEVELRYHGMDPRATTCGALRKAAAARLLPHQPASNLVLQVGGGGVLDPAGDGRLLNAAGVEVGACVLAVALAKAPLLAGGSSASAVKHAPRRPPSPPGTRTRGAALRPRVPANCVRLAVECRGFPTPADLFPAAFRLELPPVNRAAPIAELRRLLFELTGLPPEAQALSTASAGGALGARGWAESVEAAGLRPGGVLRLSALAAGLAGKGVAWGRSGTPREGERWCLHCVILEARSEVEEGRLTGEAEWRPQFVGGATTSVADLLAAAAFEFGADPECCALYYCGREIDRGGSIAGLGLCEGAAVLVVLRSTTDLTVDVSAGPGVEPTRISLRKVPGEAVIDEVITRSLVASSLSPDGASGFAAYHDGEKLPRHATLSALRVTGRSLLTLVWQQQGRGPPLASTSPPAAESCRSSSFPDAYYTDAAMFPAVGVQERFMSPPRLGLSSRGSRGLVRWPPLPLP
ncbi:hypothetical protein DIPPA_08673 [Diplonema papillatum]|nr:hypothetical protein DIPPA_08673 [Diplonema papillatum]